MSKNGMATYGKVPSYMNLTHMPDRKEELGITFANLNGGLNTYELDYMLPPNESPDVVNMRWRDGALGTRPGQRWIDDDVSRGVGHAAYEATFYDCGFFHIGTGLYYSDLTEGDINLLLDLTTVLHGDSADKKGTFFRYGDYLFYKAPGLFVRIAYTSSGFVAEDMADLAYTPVILINAHPENGSGDEYQPENRLSPNKTIWYNAATDDGIQYITTTSDTEYELGGDQLVTVTDAFLDGETIVEHVDWYFDRGTSTITLTKAPEEGQSLVVWTKSSTANYYLPVSGADLTILDLRAAMSISLVETELDGLKVTADPTEWQAAWDAYDYVYYPNTGHILFKTPAYVSWPFTNNTVKVTYSLENSAALASIMDCPYACVFGGTQDLCIVVGGCQAQPNAYFWNGNNVAMDPGYFPIDQYNLAGDTGEKITGFGKQQYMLVVFSEHSIGRANLGTQELNGRVTLTMDFTPINARIGCDLPWTIQLIENNLVFCNTDQGIHFIKDSSAAYENNIIGISRKVNGTPARVGILAKVRGVNSVDDVVSFDDGDRYWLVIKNEVYVWDYVMSNQSNPSFFYYTNIWGRGFIRDDMAQLYHLDNQGRLTALVTNLFSDYGAPIYKKYVFPTQFYNTYDRLKNVTRAIFSVKNNTSAKIEITYRTDWEERKDLTDIESNAWTLTYRDLSFRNLRSSRFAHVAIRKPNCKHIRHFQMRLENNELGCDMGIVFAQIFYNFQGRDR